MEYVFYTVKSGDQLLKIIRDHHGEAKFLAQKNNLIEDFKKCNPLVTNINLIHPGQVIMLPRFTQGEAHQGINHSDVISCQAVSQNLSRHEPDFLESIGSLALTELPERAGDEFIKRVKKATEDAVPEMRKIALNYYRKESGSITRNQYDYRRKVSILEINRRVGSLHKLITPQKSISEILRIKPHEIKRTQGILSEIEKYARVSKVAKHGGAILAVANVIETAAEVHTAESNEERTVIVLDTVAGILGGSAVGLLMVGTPVGWIGMAMLVAASTAGSVAAQAAGRAIQREVLFDARGNRITTPLDNLWKAVY
ncbi:hypothetical protein [Rhizobium straminoryzae]|uniref:LysM peptidoglycan-binding domain-containing protein n=1 Tax=Rhizobium straminoryzae TaxID=1387186 RepID=A0A549TEF1_9HYPH|nr:hypothetical protein [Rhizobium straminoryzae]TRL40523.1 hypothetical protein FNA46_06420 [Rhizobium straminoryzae]